ncbi:ATP-binding protein [Streptomyces arenae]|nr:ATP-binding protein [Streptomyces arenae]
MTLTAGAHSARHLRFILRTHLGSWGMAELADAAETALTELVANVVRHVPDRRCTVLLLRRPHGLRAEVSDGCPELPAPGEAGELAESGRGLLIVAAVADRWGFVPRRDRPGKTAWFECDAKPPGATHSAQPRSPGPPGRHTL